MAKKIWYSKPLAVVWDNYNAARKEQKDLSPREYIHQWIYSDMNNPLYSAGSYTQSHIFVADMFYADISKEFLHLFFIDNSLRDFLMDMPLKDFQGLTDYIIENGSVGKSGVISLQGTIPDNDSKISNFCFGIHIPYENKYRGYAFSFIYDYKTNELLFSYAVGNESSYLNLSNYEELLQKNTSDSEKTLQYLRLAINTIMYMAAFPDCVVDGVPELVKEEYTAKKITLSEKIDFSQSLNRVVIPHNRRGYFKRLKSDFYTKKKGQIIYVKETMVNGKAKTVYTATNLEQLLN